jgi:hypothetical protein
MNYLDLLKLGQYIPQIEAAIEVVKKYMNDPRVPQAIALIGDIEKDPEVKAAIATAELVAKTLTATGTTNEKASIGNKPGGAIGS